MTGYDLRVGADRAGAELVPHLIRHDGGWTSSRVVRSSPAHVGTALIALQDKGAIRAGQRVLITGAGGGGVGTFAVQLAKAFGAAVTAVSRTANLELMRSLGAAHVIDYTREDFTKRPERYDLVVDVGGRPSVRAIRRTLTPGGTLVLVGAGPGDWVGPLTPEGTHRRQERSRRSSIAHIR